MATPSSEMYHPSRTKMPRVSLLSAPIDSRIFTSACFSMTSIESEPKMLHEMISTMKSRMA